MDKVEINELVNKNEKMVLEALSSHDISKLGLALLHSYALIKLLCLQKETANQTDRIIAMSKQEIYTNPCENSLYNYEDLRNLTPSARQEGAKQ